jgi:hypothetical protein
MTQKKSLKRKRQSSKKGGTTEAKGHKEAQRISQMYHNDFLFSYPGNPSAQSFIRAIRDPKKEAPRKAGRIRITD